MIHTCTYTITLADYLALAVAPRIRSRRVFSLRSWWWLPLPLLMISTPARASAMCGDCNNTHAAPVAVV